MMAVLMMAAFTVGAQEKELSRVRYIERNMLMAKGDSLTIVNIYLEWPEVIMGYSMPALQEFLCRELFGCESMALDKCLENLTAKYGTPIGQMPEKEGLHVKYRTLHLSLLAYEPLRYFSGRISVKERDNVSVVEKEVNYALFTYDFRRDEILRTKDIVGKQYLPYAQNHFQFVSLIESRVEPMNYRTMDYHLPDEICLLNRKAGVVANIPNDDNHTFGRFCVIPMKYMDFFLKKNLNRKLLQDNIGKLPTKQMEPRRTSALTTEVIDEKTPDSLRIYPLVDIQPEFPGGKEKMVDYLKAKLEYPEYEHSLGMEGQLLIRFVVRRDGTITDPEVLVPISPGIDRVGVETIMGMPRWTPATINGKTVNCRVILPLNFKTSQ